MKKAMKKTSGGYMLITSLLFFLVATTAVIAGISNAVFREVRTIKNEALSKQSYYTSESSVEDAAYRIKNGKIMGPSGTLSIDSTSATVSVGTAPDGSQEITGAGDAGGTKRTTKLVLNQGTGVSFSYAAYSGVGGVDLLSGDDVHGDVYTLGSIRGSSDSSISGAAVAAGRSQSSLDQDNSLPETPTQSIKFGNANTSQDLAQSFTVTNSLSLLKFQIFVKKTGNPANATIRVTTDNGGKPSSTVLASGTLSSSLVGTSYSWIDIGLTANPILAVGTTYWIVIDASTNSSSYYTVAANTVYPGGVSRIGRYNNNSWTAPTPGDLDSYFKVYIGSNEDGITGVDQWNRITVGSAYSYEASFVNSNGALYCQIGTQNNKTCDTSRGDPSLETAPVPVNAISTWKNEAAASVQNSSLSLGYAGATVGPKKIVGDLSVSGGGTLRVSGTIWVTGNVTINGGAVVRPDDPTRSFVIIADGTINLSGGAYITGGGTGSHILLVSTSTADPAITISGGADDTAVYTPDGGVLATGGASLKAMGAKHITLDGGADLVYDPDMSIFNLSSGSGGGTFGIKSWKETE